MTEDEEIVGNEEDEEEEEEIIYIDPSMDILPPRPRFIPCLPESCFSFCFPSYPQQDEDIPRRTTEDTLKPSHTTSMSLTLKSTKGDNSNVAGRLHSNDDYMEEIPRLTSITEDGDEESSSEGSVDHATNLSSPRALLLHHYQNGQLPIELWIKLCQFLFSLLLMDRMKQMQLVHKKLLTTTATSDQQPAKPLPKHQSAT